MAALFMGSRKVVSLFGFLMISSFLMSVMSVEFDVGGSIGWIIPSSKNDQLFNDWASKNRFNVGDTLRFEYKKDSVLLVTNEEYDKCKSSHPLFFSNNGDTVFKVDKPGLFYFISGVAGHCDRGLKMIVKVLEPESPPPPPPSNETGNGGVKAAGTISSSTVVMLMTMSFFGDLFFV